MAAASPSVISGSEIVVMSNTCLGLPRPLSRVLELSLVCRTSHGLRHSRPPSSRGQASGPRGGDALPRRSIIVTAQPSRGFDVSERPCGGRRQTADPLAKGGFQRAAITRGCTIGGRSLGTCRPGLWAFVVARSGSVSEGASTRPATQIGPTPDPFSKDDAIP